MPHYGYRARGRGGEMVSGEIEGASVDAVATLLRNQGSTPITITEIELASRGPGLSEWLEKLNQKRPQLDDLVLFCRQMYSLSKAGVPIIRGISGLIETTQNRVLKAIMDDMRRGLESGRDLATSMAGHSDIFPTLMISMVRVGENTGKLDEAFFQLGNYLEMERETRKRIASALRYPAFVLIAISIALAVVNIYVIPAFSGVFDGMGMDMPWQTKLLITVSDFFVAYWRYMGVGLTLLVVWVIYYVKTKPGRMMWHKQQLKLPLVGPILHRAALARFARTFSMSSRSGVPIIQTLIVVSQAVDNDYIAEKVLSMRSGIERGDSITNTATQTGMFTPLALQMMSVGEETGAIDDMLSEVADYYQREVEYDVEKLSAAIEPIMLAAVGAIVGVLALGIFLPMWELTGMAKG
ncbi:type II secretion system F family protein [Ectothiorhodospiraceae bacterium BW-2]|nr:type II secretion system F family protein [Ectothiorhodospiraceae bacterium BW-2]